MLRPVILRTLLHTRSPLDTRTWLRDWLDADDQQRAQLEHWILWEGRQQ